MKLKKVLLSLSLAGLCFSQASAQDVPHRTAAKSAAARHIGDGVKSIGDTSRYVPMSQDARPQEFVPTGANAKPVSFASSLDMSLIAPTACDTSCNVGCNTGCSSNTWVSMESLLWFSENHRTPPLATTSAQGVRPVAGAAGVTTAFGGGDGIDAGLLPGYRVSGGRYLGDCQKVAVAGRAFGIFSDSEIYSGTSNGSTSLGIPFFNPNLPGEDAYLVGFTAPGNVPVSTGNLTVRSDLDMLGAEGGFHILLGRSNDHRIDLLAGYTYNKLKTSLTAVSESTDLFTGNLITDGTVFTTDDLFETENIFNGGHLGVLSSVVRNRVSLTTLAKVSFGNMRQTRDIRGFTVEQPPVGASTTTGGGIFTQPSNIGTFSRDVFAFIPELGVKLGYNVRDNVQLTVGYTFMFWSSVGVAGEQIDRVVDLTQAIPSPAATFQDSSFWMQGVDLGLNINF